MYVGVNIKTLGAVALHEYASRFVLGGAITVASGLIAKHYGPVLGGLFLAFPAIFPASATLLEKHQRRKKQRAGISHSLRGRLAAAIDARGAALGALALAGFAVIAWWGLPHWGALPVLAIAFVAWLSLATTFWWLRRRHSCRLDGPAR